MLIHGTLERAQLEPRTSDLANTITGAIWFRTDQTVVKLATGSGYITLTSGAPDGTTLQNSADVWSVKDGGITNAKVNASAAIAYSKLNLSNSIVAGDLTSNSVTTAKITDANVTSAKLETNLVLPSGTTFNSRPIVVGQSTNLAVVVVNYAGFTGGGTTASGEGWSMTGDGNTQAATFTFSTAFSSAPVLILSGDTITNFSISSVATSGFSYTSTAGGQNLPAFRAVFIGAK